MVGVGAAMMMVQAWAPFPWLCTARAAFLQVTGDIYIPARSGDCDLLARAGRGAVKAVQAVPASSLAAWHRVGYVARVVGSGHTRR